MASASVTLKLQYEHSTVGVPIKVRTATSFLQKPCSLRLATVSPSVLETLEYFFIFLGMNFLSSLPCMTVHLIVESLVSGARGHRFYLVNQPHIKLALLDT